MIDDTELISWIEEIPDRTVELADRLGPEAEIQGCPGWTVNDLVGHVAPLYEGWYAPKLTLTLAAAARNPPSIQPPTPLPDGFADRLAYLAAGGERFVEQVRAADLDAGVWMWGREVPARSWVTRTATEMGVHQWDLERVADDIRPVSGPRGAVSVEEHHTVMLRMLLWNNDAAPGRFHHPPIPDEAIGIEVTDADAAWVLSGDGASIAFTPAAELPATSVHGTGHDLMLYQYGRVPLDALEVHGDPGLLTAWNWWAHDVYAPVDRG